MSVIKQYTHVNQQRILHKSFSKRKKLLYYSTGKSEKRISKNLAFCNSAMSLEPSYFTQLKKASDIFLNNPFMKKDDNDTAGCSASKGNCPPASKSLDLYYY